MKGGLDAPPILTALRCAARRRLKARSFDFEIVGRSETRQLLVDVSVIVKQDARTGIQRVVRALFGNLTTLLSKDLTVQPVFASRDHGFCRAEFTMDGRFVIAGSSARARQPVSVRNGDIFLGLDLAANILPSVEHELADWRRKGVTINILIYDLLPMSNPEWFPKRTATNFKKWLGVVARQADRCICISQDVAYKLARELHSRQIEQMPSIAFIPLGSDPQSSFPNKGLPQDIERLRDWLARHRAILSVGTIEPRKGHEQLLAAMSDLWRDRSQCDLGLLLVGKPGWKTQALQQSLRQNPELGDRLIWLEDTSDELLSEIYDKAAGYISASHGEGFGLPLVEALKHGLPVLARDIPVFREIGGALFDYFTDDAPAALASQIERWMDAPRPPSRPDVAALSTWADSAAAIARCIRSADAPPNQARVS